MTSIDELTVRQLQTESARALAVIGATNNNIKKFNDVARHDSHSWYRAVIESYVCVYGGLPSDTGPGKDVKLIQDV
jgi:hypothetical protein